MAKFSTKLEHKHDDKATDRHSELEKLVDELMKDQPNKQTIKKLSAKLGMAYSVDPLTQMSTVLQSMNSVYFPPSSRKELES